jgi:LPS export ABC transporter permease LptG
VQDIVEGGSRWKGVFLADLSDPSNPTITLAESGVVIPEPDRNKLRLHLFRGSSHQFSAREPERYAVSTFGQSDLALSLPSRTTRVELRPHAELGLLALWIASQQGDQWRSTRADFHRRLMLPASALLFALVAFPLGLWAERSGRAAGFVWALLIAVSFYFLFLLGDRLARQGDLRPWLGVWLPNLAVALVGGVLWLRLRHPLRRLMPAAWSSSRPAVGSQPILSTSSPADGPRAGRDRDRPGGPVGARLPRRLDLYVARGAVFFSITLLFLLLVLFELFSLLELVDDIALHRTAWSTVARFLWFQIPQALYWMVPLAWLLGVLVELALLSKRNELVAIKTAGISLYRIALPVLFLGVLWTGILFVLDSNHLPYANQQREALLDEIKGRPPRTFFRAGRRWVFGDAPRIYYYAFFDPAREVLGRLTVFDLDPNTFAIRQRLQARRAEWNQQLGRWILLQGWRRSFAQNTAVDYQSFEVTSVEELVEDPSYFRQEVRESTQMNWRALAAYIEEVQRSGFDTTRLRVQWHKKFSFPLMCTVMVLLGFPFGLTLGRRGAVGGIATGIGLGVAFWVLSGFFEALGNLALLPASLAAWGPDLFFASAGIYLFFEINT